MPVVTVQLWPGRTHAQKAELARAITEAVVTIAHARPESTTVIIQEVSREHWAIGGVLASDAT